MDRTRTILLKHVCVAVLALSAAGCGDLDAGHEDSLENNPDEEATTTPDAGAEPTAFGLTVEEAELALANAEPRTEPEIEEDELIPKEFLRQHNKGARVYRWHSNGGGNFPNDITLMPVSTHFCALTAVRGDLGGNNSAVVVHRSSVPLSPPRNGRYNVDDDAGSAWKLAGYQFTNKSLTAEATCVPLSNFTVSPGGHVKPQLSGMFGAVAYSGRPNCLSTSKSANLPNYAAPTLAGVRGLFNGGGEESHVIVPSVSQNGGMYTTGMKVEAKAGTTCKKVEAVAVSLSFYPANLKYPPFMAVINQTISANGNMRTVRLIPTNNGFCYLTRISGDFNGAGERVNILTEVVNGVEYWALQARAEGGKAYGSVDCVWYNQKLPVIY